MDAHTILVAGRVRRPLSVAAVVCVAVQVKMHPRQLGDRDRIDGALLGAETAGENGAGAGCRRPGDALGDDPAAKDRVHLNELPP